VVNILRQFMQELEGQETGEVWQPAQDPQPEPERPQPTEPPPVEESAQRSETRLGPGHLLKVEIVGEPDMSTNRVTVAKDGTIGLPIAGRVRVTGKTLEEATKIIRDYLGADYLVNPQVRLTLLEKAKSVVTPPAEEEPDRTNEIWPGVRAPSDPIEREAKKPAQVQPPPQAKECRFSISNQVRNPGHYQWACDQRMTLLRAIGMAGGATARADLSRVTIRRSVEGKRRELSYDLRALALDPEAKPPTLQPGDEVEVPRK
jgi:protein involved in polysaccharide export with SLBB domain